LSLLAPRINNTDVKNFTPAENLTYCNTSAHQKIGIWSNLECIYLDENFAVFPTVEDHNMFITTRLTENVEILNNCSLLNYTCQYINISENSYYLADIERFTLLIDHTMYAEGITQKNARELSGYFRSYDGSNYNNLTKLPNQIGVAGKDDIIEIGTILKAAKVDLDTASDTNNLRTKRNDGIILFLTITYSNTYSYNLDNFSYTYSVNLIGNTKYKAVQPIYTKNLENRLLWNRHGVRIIVLQTGQIGKFDFPTALLSLVSGLGLLTVSTLVVDILATKILPSHGVYEKYKYEETEKIKSNLLKEKIRNSTLGQDLLTDDVEVI